MALDSLRAALFLLHFQFNYDILKVRDNFIFSSTAVVCFTFQKTHSISTYYGSVEEVVSQTIGAVFLAQASACAFFISSILKVY